MSEYRELFEQRFKKEKMDYREEMEYLFMLNAPEQYQVEDEVLNYLKSHPNATIAELSDYYDEISPHGLAPDDDGADLL